MIIDLREISVRWINLEEHKDNSQKIQTLLNSKGFKNHERIPGIRVSGFEGKNYHQNINHYMGVGIAQLNGMRLIRNSLPALILEDDVEMTPHYNPILEVPDNCDAIYLGVSSAGNPFGIKINDNYCRIFNVLTTHAIVYVSSRFVNESLERSKKCLIDDQAPFDLSMANMLSSFNVYSPVKPYFYQSNQCQSANKWEHLTNTQIKIYEKPSNI